MYIEPFSGIFVIYKSTPLQGRCRIKLYSPFNPNFAFLNAYIYTRSWDKETWGGGKANQSEVTGNFCLRISLPFTNLLNDLLSLLRWDRSTLDTWPWWSGGPSTAGPWTWELNLRCLAKVQGGLNRDLKLPNHGHQCQQAGIRWKSKCDLIKVMQSGKTCFPTRLVRSVVRKECYPNAPCLSALLIWRLNTCLWGGPEGSKVWRAGFPAWFSWELCGRGKCPWASAGGRVNIPPMLMLLWGANKG